MGFTLGKTVTDMKGNGRFASNMVREQTSFLMEMFTPENIKMANQMGRANILGEMAKFMWGSSRMD